jgi:PST family polysaccharide transporter
MTKTTQRITKGAGWIYTYRWLDRLLGFVSIVVLARILVPEDFGLVAIAASYVAILEGLSDFDVNKALIRARDHDRSLYDSAWTLSVLRGIVSALLMILIAPFVGDPRMTAILYVLAVSPLLQGLSNPRFVMFERQLVYSKLAVLTLTAKIVSFSVTLYIAFVYRSYWALVLGIVAGSLTSAVLTYLLKPYRPRFSFARFSEIFAFSGWMSLATAVTTLSMQTDRIIVGRLLGVADAGSYYMTQRVGVVPTSELISPLQRILFPTFSEITEDKKRLRSAVRESVNILGSLSLPAGIGFALVANDFVPIVLGETWQMIVPLLVVLVPFLGFRGALSMTLPCIMALGRTRLLFKVSLVYALVHLPAFIAATALFGLTGAIWSIVLAGFFYSYLNAWMLKETLGITISEIATQLRRPLLAVSLMMGSILLANAVLPVDLFSETGSWLSLGIKIVLGAVVSCAAQYAIWRFEDRPAGIERRLVELLTR